MNFKRYNSFLLLFGFVFLIYLLHRGIFYLFDINDDAFIYSLDVLYLFFLTLSYIICAIIVFVKAKNFDNVGLVFLLATSIKMIICYLALRPLLQIPKHNNVAERMNFFSLFMLFLVLETLFTILLVNEKK